MAEQHLCQRHGRPAVASTVRLRPDGTQEVEEGAAPELLRERKEEKTPEPAGSPA